MECMENITPLLDVYEYLPYLGGLGDLYQDSTKHAEFEKSHALSCTILFSCCVSSKLLLGAQKIDRCCYRMAIITWGTFCFDVSETGVPLQNCCFIIIFSQNSIAIWGVNLKKTD